MPLTLLFAFGFGAAFLGTVAMTISQEIEIYVNKRPISYSPAIAVFKILRLNFDNVSLKMKGVYSYLVHFIYGTFFGFLLPILLLLNVTNVVIAVILFYVIIVLQGWIVIPLVGAGGPVWTWGWKAVSTEAFHKGVYTLATFYFFTLLLSYYA